MDQLRDDRDLSNEPVRAEDFAHLRMKHLDRDRTLVTGIPRQEDGGHPAAAHQALNLIPTFERLTHNIERYWHDEPPLAGSSGNWYHTRVGSRGLARRIGWPTIDVRWRFQMGEKKIRQDFLRLHIDLSITKEQADLLRGWLDDYETNRLNIVELVTRTMDDSGLAGPEVERARAWVLGSLAILRDRTNDSGLIPMGRWPRINTIVSADYS